MQKSGLLIALALICSTAGALLSNELLGKHLKTTKDGSLLSSLCDTAEDGQLTCDTVVNSKWGMYPFEKEGDPPNTARVPTALLGVMYYSAAFIWFACVGRPSHDRRWWHLLPLLVVMAGAGGSIFFIYIMKTELETICQLCLYSHIANFALLLVTILLWPRKPKPIDGDKAEADSELPSQPSHPGLRLAVVTIVLIMAVVQLEKINALLKLSQRSLAQSKLALKTVQDSVQSLVAIYQAQDHRDVTIRDDDPIRNNAPGLPTLVIFSDFQCVNCRKFEEQFLAEHLPHFDGYLRIVFKHYPLSSQCNPNVANIGHPFACAAAELAEAARLQGGNDKFWQAHDYLFERQSTLNTLDVRDFAKDLELDLDQLRKDVASEAVKTRIAQDISLGKALGVTGTPGVFLSGRYVPPMVRSVDLFWQRMGQLYQNVRDKREDAH